MKSLMKRGTAALASAVIAGGISASAIGGAFAQAKLEDNEVTIGLPLITGTFLPIFLADEEGFFEDEGLEVEIVAFRGGSDVARGLVAESVDMAVTAPASALAAIQADQDVKVFFGGFTMTPFSWYAKSDIKNWEDAKGARFGITRYGSSTDVLTRYVIQEAGLDPEKDVQIVQSGGSGERLAAIEAGQLDAALFSWPHNFMAADRGLTLLTRQGDLMEDYPNHAFMALAPYIESHPETIKAVLRAFIRGIRLAKADKDRAVKALVDRAQLEEQYAIRFYDEVIDTFAEDGRMASEAGIQNFMELSVQAGEIPEVYPKERYWDDRFVSTIADWGPKKQ